MHMVATIALLLLFITVNDGCYLGDTFPLNTPGKLQIWTIVSFFQEE